ncbi:DUF2231 domain-containing protein [Singulisphaera sp. PoT]|uniref:DUF2231 domain-containing protein n=1 Tax=Singulisphaera sp. PoT TaxID=3411797 RepID=UPI003BF5E460
MLSKAQFKGHPIHPMLVSFPIAFLCGALGFDAAAKLLDWPGGRGPGAYLSILAVLSGLVAAVPGIIDFLHVVPPNSSGYSRARQHMIINGSALVLFALGWIFRDLSTLAPGLGTLVLEASGVGLITWGGWLGGTLAYRNQIGVDHRYAGASRWSEEKIDAKPGSPVVVAREGDLKVDQMKLLRIGERRIVLARTDRGYAAFDDRCSHKGGPLSDGALICGTVQCPWHGSQFEVDTGKVKAGPAEAAIATYPVEVVAGEVRLSLS